MEEGCVSFHGSNPSHSSVGMARGNITATGTHSSEQSKLPCIQADQAAERDESLHIAGFPGSARFIQSETPG